MKTNAPRQPYEAATIEMSGMAIAVPSFAAASKIAVARPRSWRGNHVPIALALPGNVGASPTPSKSRAPKNVEKFVAAAVRNDATLHRSAPTRPIVITPKRSSTSPTGICSAAYV